jgi:hypothetical protein
MAAQLMVTSRCELRRERSCNARATTSDSAGHAACWRALQPRVGSVALPADTMALGGRVGARDVACLRIDIA